MTNTEISKALDIKISPSDITQMAEDEIGEALRRIREQAKRVKNREQLHQLQELRADLNARLDQFLNIHMSALNKHPDITHIIEELQQLTLGVKAAVKQIRTFKSAVEKGTKILGYADRFLGLLGELGGVLA